jgi:hypothetical protein
MNSIHGNIKPRLHKHIVIGHGEVATRHDFLTVGSLKQSVRVNQSRFKLIICMEISTNKDSAIHL